MKIARLSGRRAKTQTFAVAGGELTLTRAQMMELYVLSRRGQAKELSLIHIFGRVNEEIRGKTAQNIQNGVGGFMGDAAAFLYQTGMSVEIGRAHV